MRLAVQTGTVHPDWDDLKSFVIEAERIGVDSAWTAEFMGHDVFTPLAFIAAHTSGLRLGTGVATLGARSPAALAMTAMSLASMSDGRFILGLGAGAGSFVKGWHGAPFPSPSANLRETIEIVRLVASGAEARHPGPLHPLPGDGNPAFAADPGARAKPFPVYIAALSPRSLELTGEIADGWVGDMTFMPEIADTYFSPIARGAARAGRTLADIDLVAPTFMAFGDVEQALKSWKPMIAGFLGSDNSHGGAYRRAGFGAACDQIQDAVGRGDMQAAAAAVPDEFVLHSKLVGDDAMVGERLRAYRRTGAATLHIYLPAPPLTGYLDPLSRLKSLLDGVNAE